ncbi:MAG: hypothetical protein ACFFCS_29850 [Candidatus Hodarchaeota archaeon]
MSKNQTLSIPGKIYIKPDIYYMCYVCSESVIGKHLKPRKMGKDIIWMCKDCAEGLE